MNRISIRKQLTGAFACNVLFALSLSLCPLLSPFANAQAQFVAPEDMTVEEPEQPSLGEIIGEIAEKANREAVDYHQLAEMTLQLGQAAMQQGQRLPDPSIWDGIRAVDAGERLNPAQTDWKALRSELEKLLEKPPEQDPEQQPEQNQQDQNQENSESQENSENQESEGSSGDSQSNQSSDPRQEDSESSPEPNEPNEGQSKTEQDPSGDQERSNDPQDGEGNEQNRQPQTNQTLGDMDDNAQPEQEQTPQPQPEKQNQIGGTQQEKPIRSAKQAMTKQQLEQVKQQDKPGALHMLLQQAEQAEQAPNPQKNLKDW